MKQATLKLTALVLLLGGAITTTKAQTANSINVVTSAVPFLRISPDARAGGMGDAGIATNPDQNSNFWNIAKTPLYVPSGATPHQFAAQPLADVMFCVRVNSPYHFPV